MNPTEQPLVVRTAAQIAVETSDRFDLYRPTTPGPHPVVLIVTGYPDPGMVQCFGRAPRHWVGYQDWARLLAAEGMAVILYSNQAAADAHGFVCDVRNHAGALNVDPARIGVLACSGHAPTALGVFAKERVRCAALLYPYLLDLPGHDEVAKACAQFHCAPSGVTLEELPCVTPLLVVRAGQDTTPGLDASLQRFVIAAKARNLAISVIEHATGPHAFDLLDDSPRTREVIPEIVAFMRYMLVD